MYQVIRVCGDVEDEGADHGLETVQYPAELTLDETEWEPSAMVVHEVGNGWTPGTWRRALLKEVSEAGYCSRRD